MKKRQALTMRNLYQYCRLNRHEPVADQFKKLSSKLQTCTITMGLLNYWTPMISKDTYASVPSYFAIVKFNMPADEDEIDEYPLTFW